MNGRKSDNERIKKPPPYRRVGGAQKWKELVSHPCVVDKNLGGIPEEQGVPALLQVPPAQDSSARKISPHNFWLQNPVGIESVEETSGAPSSSS